MRSVLRIPSKAGGKVRLDDGKFGKFSVRLDFGTSLHSSQTCPRRSGLANNHEQTQSCLQSAFIWRMSANGRVREVLPIGGVREVTSNGREREVIPDGRIPIM